MQFVNRTHTCSATTPPRSSLLFTKAVTSLVMMESKLSMAGGSGSAICFEGTMVLSDEPEFAVVAEVAGAPFVDADGSMVAEAISSNLEVAASSLRRMNVSIDICSCAGLWIGEVQGY